MDKSNIKPQGDVVFALDIGTRTVVGILGEQRDDVFEMLDYIVEPHPKRAMIDGQIEDIRQVAKIVNKVKDQLAERVGIKLERVSIAAAGRALRTKRVSMKHDISNAETITFDMIKSMEIETIQKAAEEIANERGTHTPYYCVGHSIIGYLLDDYKMITLEGHKGEVATIELIATFLPNVVVEGLYSVMDMCNLSVSSLTLEPIAAMNAIIPQEIRLINIALVDIGAGTSDIAISKEGSIVAYAMATTAGDEITEEIIKTYFVDFDTAEKIKQECCDFSGEAGQTSTGTVYRDIFGIERKITPEEFAEKIEPSVDVLAETICVNVTEANSGSSPAAVFLIGGGSLVKGLSEAVSEKLGIPLERVALGSYKSLKHIDTKGVVMGAEFVTPLGIAVTGVINKGYDFSVITLNDKSIRIFDTNKVTVFELLTVAGFKSAEILGRSGHNLTYTINDVRKTIRGGGFEPARLLLGGNPVSLSANITGGDKVEFTPAVNGENARILLKDAVLPGVQSMPDELGVKVNGEDKPWDYSVQNLDKIETYIIEGEEPEFLENAEVAAVESDTVVLTPEEEKAAGEINITLNGVALTLPKNNDGMPHTFLELLNYSELDLDNPEGGYIMTVNGVPASFNDVLADGDQAVLKWDTE
ncbi:MAG: rod shape-determining protein [Oscillospiraceae bacterium]|nr:rod shape-determining protein [Oscillospiraceae bacterium]